MLVFKAKNVLALVVPEEKPYDFKDDKTGEQRKGTSYKGTITAVGVDDRVAVITVKGKTLEQARAKFDALKLKQGQPAEILITPAVVGGVSQLAV